MPRVTRLILTLIACFALCLLVLAGIAALTFTTGVSAGTESEWLVGLGFAALWGAILAPALIVAVIVTARFTRQERSRPADPASSPPAHRRTARSVRSRG